METMSLSHELHVNTSAPTLANQRIDKFFYVDTPEARRTVTSGLEQLRNAGFSLYGQPEDAKNTSTK